LVVISVVSGRLRFCPALLFVILLDKESVSVTEGEEEDEEEEEEVT
jgi:hypothetical protein